MRAREGAPVPLPTPPRWPRTPPSQPKAASTRRRNTHSGLAGAVMVLILLIAVGVKFGPGWAARAAQDPPAPATTYGRTTTPKSTTATAQPATQSTAQPTAGPAGLVTIEQPGALATEVAAMFETYFGAINADDPARALSVVQPSRKLDPSKPGDVADFSRAISTTRDEDIRLGAVSGGGSTVSAELSFHSRQDPGYGPKGSPNETCTAWTMHYLLVDGGAGLLIKSVEAQHRAC